MPRPWEKYANNEVQPQAKPWEKYGQLEERTGARELSDQLQETESDPDYWRAAAQGVASIPGMIAGAALGPAGAVGGGALTGAMGGQVYDLARAYLSEGELPSGAQQAQRAVEDVAYDVAVPAVAGKVLTGAARAGKAALTPLKSYVGGKVGPVGAQTVQQIERAQTAGFKPEIGMLDTPEAQQFSQSLRNMPGSGNVMAQIDRHNLEQGAKIADDVARELGDPMTRAELGGMIRQEAQAATDRFFKGANVLYDRVAEFVPEQVKANKLKLVVDDVLGQTQESAVAGEYLKDVVGLANLAAQDIAEDGTVAKRTLSRLRKLAEPAYKKNPAMRTESDNFIMRLERAADSDITEAAIDMGGNKAADAVRRAKDWWKMGKGNQRLGDVGILDDTAHILKQTEDGKITNWLMSEGKDGSTRLRRVFNAMSREGVGDVRASAFRELGTPPAGQLSATSEGFSFNSFLTNYNKLSPEAQKVLFGKASSKMNSLLEVSEYMKALEKRANFSNTATVSAWRELLDPIGRGIVEGSRRGATGAIVGGLRGTAEIGVNLAMGNRMANLVADPNFVKWLAESGKKIMFKSTDMAPQFAKLADIARRSPSKAADYTAYMQSLGVNTRTVRDKDGNLKSVEVK